jgi:hypothetical protein
MSWYEVIKQNIYDIKYQLYCAGLPEKHSKLIIKIELQSNNYITRHTIIRTLTYSNCKSLLNNIRDTLK